MKRVEHMLRNLQSFMPKSDWTTLKLTLDISLPFAKTNKLCDVVQIIPKFVKKRLSNIPNKRVMKILYKNIKKLALNIWMQ